MSTSTPPDDELQFATAERAPGYDASTADALSCAECSQPIRLQYFEVAGRVVCTACKGKLERMVAGEGTSRGGRVMRALAYGGVAVVLGAVIWFAIAALFNLEIGLVAILIGWMVGRAVHAGSAGRGGRRYQVMAAVMTYLSVALSYGALAVREFSRDDAGTAAAAIDSSAVRDSSGGAFAAAAPAAGASASSAATAADDTDDDAAAAATGDSTATASAWAKSPLLGLTVFLGFVLAMPIALNLASMPGGLLGLAILGFGIHQAWKMNAPVELVITGPHKVNRPPAEPAPAA